MDVSPPFSEQNRLITPLNINYFQDSQLFLQKCSRIKRRDLSRFIDRVIFSDRVQTELRHQTRSISIEQQSTAYKRLLQESREFLNSLSSQINPRTIKTIFFMFHTLFKRVYEQIIINDAELKQVKALLSKPGESVILMPSFKSYMDMILIQYIHIIYGLDLAFLSGE